MNLTQASNYYVEKLINKTTDKRNVFVIILFISAFCLIFAMIFLFPILINVT